MNCVNINPISSAGLYTGKKMLRVHLMIKNRIGDTEVHPDKSLDMSRLHHSTHSLTHAYVKKELDLKPVSIPEYKGPEQEYATFLLESWNDIWKICFYTTNSHYWALTPSTTHPLIVFPKSHFLQKAISNL